MPTITYTTKMATPRGKVWPFVSDINNWAPLVRGYQSHEIISDRESIWTVRGEVGPISRITKVHINVTEWVDGEKVAFTLQGLNEPVSGEGAIIIRDDGDGTEISGTGSVQFGGALGPMVNRLLAPFVQSVTDELVTKVVAAVQNAPGGTAAVTPRTAEDGAARLRRLYLWIVRWMKTTFGRGHSAPPPAP